MANESTRLPFTPMSRHQALMRSVPVFVVLLVIGGIYYILSDQLFFGPRWLVLGLMVLLVPVLMVAIRIGHVGIGHIVGITLLVIITLAEASATSALIVGILTASVRTNQVPHDQAIVFLEDASLVWAVNILTFAFWHWEIDGGGPTQRHHVKYDSSDLVFPQSTLDSTKDKNWIPHFVDYLFLAFNTSTAFSPTDTLILSVRAKILMMVQSIISLILLAVIVARAINTL